MPSVNMKYSGSTECTGPSSATKASAVSLCCSATLPLTRATPICGNTMASASPASSKRTAWAVKSAELAKRSPFRARSDFKPASVAPSLKVTRCRPVFSPSPPASRDASISSSVDAVRREATSDNLASLFPVNDLLVFAIVLFLSESYRERIPCLDPVDPAKWFREVRRMKAGTSEDLCAPFICLHSPLRLLNGEALQFPVGSASKIQAESLLYSLRRLDGRQKPKNQGVGSLGETNKTRSAPKWELSKKVMHWGESTAAD